MTLRALIRKTDAALAAGQSQFRGRVLRGAVHLRPENGYSGLVVLEAESRRSGGAGDAELLSSATAWEWVRRHREPVAIDISLQRLEPLDKSSTPSETLPGWVGRTRQHLSARQVTHLLCLPIRAIRGQVHGMLTLELCDPMGAGQRLAVWDSHGAQLQLIADVAAPFLALLPASEDTQPQPDALLPVIGARMAPIVRILSAFSRSSGTVLLRGATGTGKSHIARWCHENSPRKSGPFVVATLNTLPEHTREGELFGWTRGAFTGAVSRHRGLVERAEGGTLFIDEIDKADLTAQGKLLRLLEERRYQVLGDERDRLADVRFIIGSNANLEEAVAEGRFLEDLYFRINVLPVQLPSLSERRDEIGGWGAFMLGRIHRDQGGSGATSLSEGATSLLATRPWPGNLRQLYSVVFRAYTLASLESIEGGGVAVSREQIELALGLDASRDRLPVTAAIASVAEAFIDEAQRRATLGEALDIEHTRALRGAVLDAATRRLGSVRDAFTLFGLEGRLKGGNHLKTFRREWERVVDLYQDFGAPSPPQPSEDSLQ